MANLVIRCNQRTITNALFYVSTITLIAVYSFTQLSSNIWNVDSYNFFLIVGFIFIWRYGWKIINMFRGLAYKYIIYPRIKKRALKTYIKPDEIFILVASYRIDPVQNYQVYQSIFKEAATLNCPVNIISLSTDSSDLKILDSLQTSFNNENIKMFTLFQDGKGKRSAMHQGLSFIKKMAPKKHSAIVLMDGDCMLEEGVLKNSYAVLSYRKEVGAVTVNNKTQVVDDRGLVREWYNLKMINREFYMCSHALSNKVLVLTGRFSMFKSQALMRNEFISNIKYDHIEHWRFNRINMLTGDDKTTWFYLLKDGWDMLFLPDEYISSIEELPSKNFIQSTVALSRRWSGNMLRNNIRALKLGPSKTGFFIWVAILDQRISIWTTLAGPAFAALIIIFIEGKFIWLYILWLILTRAFQSAITYTVTRDFHPAYIPLLMYDQFAGSLIKSYGIFHLQKQKWDRQKISSASNKKEDFISNLLWLTFLFLIFTLIFIFVQNSSSINIISNALS